MEPNGDSPPTWSTPSTIFVPVRRRRCRSSSFLIPVTLTIAFFILLIFIALLLLPSTQSRNNQVLKLNSSVKKSWNSINILLVLFALLCGVFARRNDENSSSDGAETVPNAYEFVTSGRRSVSGADWLGSPDRKTYDKMSNYMNIGGHRLRRSSSSYPDLRQESLWRSDGGKSKSFDDFEVDFHRTSGNLHRRVRQTHEVEKDVVAETPAREIPVDKLELNNSVPPPPTQPISQVPQPPPPPPPPPPSVKKRRSVHSFPKQYNGKKSPLTSPSKTPPATMPPPPPPPELMFHPLAERREKMQRRKSGTTKGIATAIVSVLYQGTQSKRNNKVRSRDIFESVALNSSLLTKLVPSSIQSVPPPPPPPPPPAKKVLQNFFKNSSKSKRVHSFSTANPPPPPPPPPNSIFNSIFKTGSRSKRFQSTSATSQTPPPPPPPPPSSIFNSLFKNGTKSRSLRYIDPQPRPPPQPTPRSWPKHSPASTGKPPKPTKPSTSPYESVVIAPSSPLIPMPPLPPPFTVPEMKFIARGGFVRIRSANSSRYSSPGLEDFDVTSVKSDGGDSIGPSRTCPSPDVDLKANTFISKRRDEWRLERINSLKEQRNTGSSSARIG